MLDCSDTNIGDLPELIKLQKLKSKFCRNLTDIPTRYFPILKGIDCSFCTGLVDIGDINTLKVLKCSECPLLFRIYSTELVYLECQNCPSLLSIPNMPRLNVIVYYNFLKKYKIELRRLMFKYQEKKMKTIIKGIQYSFRI